MEQKPPLRERIARWIALLSIVVVSVTPLMLLYMWLYAWQHGLYPKVPIPANAYRGPWSDDQILMSAWDHALFLPVYSFVIALVSLIIKPNLRTGITLGFCIACFILVLCHVGLVED
jgi:hypothetical protein